MVWFNLSQRKRLTDGYVVWYCYSLALLFLSSSLWSKLFLPLSCFTIIFTFIFIVLQSVPHTRKSRNQFNLFSVSTSTVERLLPLFLIVFVCIKHFFFFIFLVWLTGLLLFLLQHEIPLSFLSIYICNIYYATHFSFILYITHILCVA